MEQKMELNQIYILKLTAAFCWKKKNFFSDLTFMWAPDKIFVKSDFLLSIQHLPPV